MEGISAQTPGVRFYQDTQPLKNMQGPEQLKAVAGQFEAMYMQMMLQSMRDASNAMAGDESLFNTQQHRFYQDMADKQMAMELSGSSNLGIADAMVRQLGGELNNNVKSDAIPNNMVGSANEQPLTRIKQNLE